ncbi:MAG: 4Fe-4S dicluster domain-containing protein [Desulfobacterium sp.]|nr:4Fe-4S dicluster domain-containing protein [Desulfobacterium sp.]
MKPLKPGKTFQSKINGVPQGQATLLERPKTVALVPGASPFVKLKLLVGENDTVSVGTPLLQDKRDPKVLFLSPGGGRVAAIRRGARRVVQEVVIDLADDGAHEPALSFAPISPKALKAMSRMEVVNVLKLRGIWPLIRQFPFMDIPQESNGFPMAVVSLHSGERFNPVPSLFLKDQQAAFLHGLTVLQNLADRVVVTAPRSAMAPLKALGLAEQVTHVVQDAYPAGDPGVILYQIRKSAAENASCTMDPQELIAMGHLLSTGNVQCRRIYAVSGTPTRPASHYQTRTGTPVSHLVGPLKQGKGIVTGGVFTGTITSGDAHMGMGITTATVLDGVDTDAFFGFAWPGRRLLSESRTFLSCLESGSLGMDVTLHGEERACINCGWCDKKCPVDLLPQFIMKAASTGEMEEPLALGLLDCTGCGLCTFVCPSKIDLAGILALSKQTCYRERVMP